MQLSPRVAFFNVLVFVTVSLLCFMGRMQMHLNPGRIQLRNADPKAKSLSEHIVQYFWSIGKNRYEAEDRATLWEAAVNKSRNSVRTKRFPDVVIAGAEHCGTAALARLLLLHPLVKAARNIETRFFTSSFAKGASYYMEQMPWVSPGDIVMESSSAYFSWPPLATPKRIKDMMPDAKILIVLCNPVDRAHVDYVTELKMGRIPKNSKYELILGTYLPKFGTGKWSKYSQWEERVQTYIVDMFRSEYASHILTSGMYYHHLVRWRAEFDLEHLKVVSRDDLMERTGKEMEELQKFLGLPQLLSKEDFVYHNVSQSYCFQPTWPSKLSKNAASRCPMSSEVKKRPNQTHTCEQSLKRFYAPFNRKLYRNLGRDFEW